MTSATHTHRRFNKRLVALGTGLALVATGAIGAQSFADDEDGAGPLPPPGEQPVGQPGDEVAEAGDLVIGSDALIQTGSSTFDETVLTKYIPANGLQVFQGAGASADTVAQNGDTCLQPAPGSGGNATILRGPVELPDGARINQIEFFGQDNDAAEDIAVELTREEFNTPFVFQGLIPVSTRELTSIDSFSTSGQQADASVFRGAADLGELTGSPATGGISIASVRNRFHTVEVSLRNAAGGNHVVCGIKVYYQVAKSSADAGTVYHAVDSYRAFDSRLASFGALSGRLAPNTTKVIDITDGYDSAGVAIPAQANLIPANATAITYNITVAGQTGPNFVAVTTGDAASFTASAINYPGSGSLANGATVTIASDQTIKLWGGDNTGSGHVIIDVTGFYAPAPPVPNMGN